MPGPWALAWLREQVGQGLAWGGATAQGTVVACRVSGGGRLAGDNPRLGHSSHSGGAKSQPAHRGGRAPGQCWAWELSRGHGLKALGLGVEANKDGHGRAQALYLGRGSWRKEPGFTTWLSALAFSAEPVLERPHPCPPPPPWHGPE